MDSLGEKNWCKRCRYSTIVAGNLIGGNRWVYGDLFDTIEALQAENEQLRAQVAQVREALRKASACDRANWFECDSIDVYSETVGQFTGVKEHYPQMVGEGQEIYFGDIVRLFGGEYCQGYHEHDQTIVVKSVYDIVAMEESENVQLLGNVWDNPELLKEGSV